MFALFLVFLVFIILICQSSAFMYQSFLLFSYTSFFFPAILSSFFFLFLLFLISLYHCLYYLVPPDLSVSLQNFLYHITFFPAFLIFHILIRKSSVPSSKLFFVLPVLCFCSRRHAVSGAPHLFFVLTFFRRVTKELANSLLYSPPGHSHVVHTRLVLGCR